MLKRIGKKRYLNLDIFRRIIMRNKVFQIYSLNHNLSRLTLTFFPPSLTKTE